LHTVAQLPQWFATFSCVSQVFPSLSQSPQSVAQVVTSQLPVVHESVACAIEHSDRHEPQFVSVLIGC
jgi:hypothetical protein